MITFKSTSDLEQFRNNPLHDIVKELVSPYIDDPDYRPQDDGYVALIEPGDVDRELDDIDIPWQLSEVPYLEETRSQTRQSHTMWP